MAITREDIFKAADALDAAGQSPTLSAVRKALGGGSFTTISQPLAEWKAKRNAKEVPLRDPPPPAIIEQFNELGIEIWSHALALANGRLDAERQSIEKTRTEIDGARQEAADMADQLSSELEETRQNVTLLTTERGSLQDLVLQLKADLAESVARSAHAEARTQEISHRVHDLNAQLTRVNSQNSDLIQALAQRGLVQDTEKLQNLPNAGENSGISSDPQS